MKLKQALKRVIALLPKNDQSAFYKVRFASDPSSVFVTDGSSSSIVYVDEDDLIDFVCNASVIVKAVKDKGDLSFQTWGGGQCALCTDNHTYTLTGEDTTIFPYMVHPTAEFDRNVDISVLNNVMYAASKDGKSDGLPYIHFADGFIEATDRIRLVKVLANFGWEGLLPIQLFNKWPKRFGEGGFVFDGLRAYFLLGDEVRYAFPVKEAYPNTVGATTISKGIGQCALIRKWLLEAVKQANELSEVKGVSLNFGDKVEIKSLGRESIMDSYVGSLETEEKLKEGNVSVSAKLLTQSLRNMKSDVVLLMYEKYPSPLVLRGGDTLVYIWPMLNE